jgi:hypothetical protein
MLAGTASTLWIRASNPDFSRAHGGVLARRVESCRGGWWPKGWRSAALALAGRCSWTGLRVKGTDGRARDQQRLSGIIGRGRGGTRPCRDRRRSWRCGRVGH